jgi:hypothetical protein
MKMGGLDLITAILKNDLNHRGICAKLYGNGLDEYKQSGSVSSYYLCSHVILSIPTY